ncbi:alpha/beta fold hydrolase [Flavobacterium sp.]|uniref:alpha/beta hydrolase n=1 Tax=Flavobacterium sp. TaxID=239 RepID=UPI002613514D|nr:alpha/beta fold hydrolase [Flavobacterium sp.]MDD3005359.1 alpha/beta fold hydrolase [Flavobacterium sp.]
MEKIKYYLLTKSIGLGLNLVSFIQPKKATLLAYRLFSQPRKGKLSESELPKVLQNITSENYISEEVPLRTYVWKGNENVILLVHGWESNTSRWEKLLPYLQKTGSTIVALDAPAHGLSGGKEFNIIKYAHSIDVVVKQYQPSVLIGHSIGGASCIYYQSHFKNNLLQKMIILGAPSDYKIIVANYVQLLSLNQRMNNLLENYFSVKFQKDIDTFKISSFAEQIQIPGLIFHDVDDDVVAFGEGEKIAKAWKNADLIATKGLGHSLHDHDVYTKILDFITS